MVLVFFLEGVEEIKIYGGNFNSVNNVWFRFKILFVLIDKFYLGLYYVLVNVV